MKKGTRQKISIVTGPLAGHGGEETILIDFISHMSSSYHLDLYITDLIGGTAWLSGVSNNVSIHYHKQSRIKLWKILRYFFYLCFCDSSMIIVFTPKLLYFAYIVKKIFRKHFKIVSWVQFSIIDYFPKNVQAYLKLADKHLAISTGIKSQLLDLGILGNDIFIIHNPISRESQTILPDRQMVKFVYIGRIQFKKQKNLKELLDACNQLTGKWQLEIFGADTTLNQVEFHKCQEYIERLNLEEKVKWRGWASHPWTSISNASCLVLCSSFEGFGMVLAEAVSRGVPIISSNCPVGPDDIVNAKNGFLYEKNDSTDLANRMQGFIDGDYEFNAQSVKASIEFLYSNYYYVNLKHILETIS